MSTSFQDHPILAILNRPAVDGGGMPLRILPVENRLRDLPRSIGSASERAFQTLWSNLLRLSQTAKIWAKSQLAAKRRKKRLRICESVSLGDKRFLAVIQVDGEQFLVGGAANSVAMLAQLDKRVSFSDLLNESRGEANQA